MLLCSSHSVDSGSIRVFLFLIRGVNGVNGFGAQVGLVLVSGNSNDGRSLIALGPMNCLVTFCPRPSALNPKPQSLTPQQTIPLYLNPKPSLGGGVGSVWPPPPPKPLEPRDTKPLRWKPGLLERIAGPLNPKPETRLRV